MISKHSAHSTSLPVGYRTWLWRYTCLLLLISMLWHLRYLIFQIISVIDGWGISCELALRWMSIDLTEYKSTFVQVMAWCRQATSHYLNQWWPRSLSPYGFTRSQWVKHKQTIRTLCNQITSLPFDIKRMCTEITKKFYIYVIFCHKFEEYVISKHGNISARILLSAH